MNELTAEMNELRRSEIQEDWNLSMTVYVIVQLKMTDRAAYDRYQARFFGVFKQFNGRLLAADESPDVLEGSWDRDKVVLMSFPDEAAYRAWANSPEYQEISKDPQSRRRRHRAAGEGVGPVLSGRPDDDVLTTRTGRTPSRTGKAPARSTDTAGSK